MTTEAEVYEVSSWKDRDGFDLICDCLRCDPIWYARADALHRAGAYAPARRDSKDGALIRRAAGGLS